MHTEAVRTTRRIPQNIAAGSNFLVYFWPRGHISRVRLAAGSHFSCVFGRGVKFLVCFWMRGQIYRVFWPRGQLSRVFWPRDQFSCVFFGRGVKCLVCALAAGSIFACMFGRGVKFPKKIIASDLGPRSKLCESVVGTAKSRPRDPKGAQESPKHANTRTPGRAFFPFSGLEKGDRKSACFWAPGGLFSSGGGGASPKRRDANRCQNKGHKTTKKQCGGAT